MAKHAAEPSMSTKVVERLEENLSRAYGRREPLPGWGQHRAGYQEAQAA